jgi:hypothetical protein
MPDAPPTDSADHAQDFAYRWADRLDVYREQPKARLLRN